MSYDREKRAKRRKRNVMAKELRTNPLFMPKVINKKPKRIKLRPEDIPDDEEYLDWADEIQDEARSKQRLPRVD